MHGTDRYLKPNRVNQSVTYHDEPLQDQLTQVPHEPMKLHHVESDQGLPKTFDVYKPSPFLFPYLFPFLILVVEEAVFGTLDRALN